MNFLGKTGLQRIWNKIKTLIPTKTSQLEKDDVYTQDDIDLKLEVIEKYKADKNHKHTASEVGAMKASSVVTAFWNGTQAEYDAITVKDSATLYLINEG